MTASKSCLIILVTCFYVHACNSRLLWANGFRNEFPMVDKIEEKDRVLSMNFSPDSSGKIDNNTNGAKSGNQDLKSSSMRALESATKASRWPQSSEEDLIETDYQLPHRKSPIHN